ncbi:MAG: NADH-quinone oxidoreductase subunit N [Ignavibacteriae bacterium]|nr:MAG: NADH-quinone oxidoreductase subunit N [Ignavibacteriota bacterium]
MLENLANDLSLIVPEIVVSVTLLVIVIFDLIYNKDKSIIPYIGIVGLFIALYYSISDLNITTHLFKVSNADNKFGLLTVDPFAGYFKIIILVTSILIVFFSKASVEIQKISNRSGEYYALLFGMILGMMFMTTASDLIMIYISVELLSLSSYVLAGFTKSSLRNSEASLKYLLYGAVSSGFMLFGMSILFGLTGTTNLLSMNEALSEISINTFVYSFAIILIFAGIGFKISAAPFHFWTPDVYEGSPISITAFLSVASKAAGFAILIRFIKATFFVESIEGSWILLEGFDWQKFIIVISVLTMTLGNFAAIWQDNLKRMLAYSSIAHAGYMLLGVAVLSNQGLVAVLIYFLVYLLMNIGAFYIIMLIANQIKSENINDYNRLGYASPFLGVSLTIFLISLTGLPPTAGFISKLYIFISVLDAGMLIVAVIAVLNSVVSLYYYIRVLKHMFISKAENEPEKLNVSLNDIVFILILLVPTILFGVYFSPIVDFAQSCLQIFVG